MISFLSVFHLSQKDAKTSSYKCIDHEGRCIVTVYTSLTISMRMIMMPKAYNVI